MTDSKRDPDRAVEAAKVIIDGRDPGVDFGAIMVTLEGAVATILIALMRRYPKRAAAMLNEGLLQGVERRIAQYESMRGSR